MLLEVAARNGEGGEMKEKSHSFLFFLIPYLIASILVGIMGYVFIFSIISNYIKLLGNLVLSRTVHFKVLYGVSCSLL